MRVIVKCPTFASAFGNEGSDGLTFWQKRCKNPVIFLLFGIRFHTISALGKEKREKTSGFIWKITNKVLTFAPAFKKKAAIFGILI